MKGGEEAFRLKLTEKYLHKMNHLADAQVEVILPGKLHNFEDWVTGPSFICVRSVQSYTRWDLR